ncbi:hypothetical protein QBC37DRAFT_377517 [Rhypophila decipiens]|uniref:Uncharacterized protein n=1 Tax=Rhypophila decipiens TaxID=261697 RepID=A0AAN7B3X4_9PEZI|nr:hypothetical protein QBC37DRAFT_377517 [Rhypophila decipiens]
MAPTQRDLPDDRPTEVHIVPIFLALLTVYLCFFFLFGKYMACKVYKRWPNLLEDRWLDVVAFNSVFLLSLLWPIGFPAFWAKKAKKEQEIELAATERVRRMQEAEQQRLYEEHKRFMEFEEAKLRVQRRMDAELGRQPVPVVSSENGAAAAAAVDAKAPEEGMPDVTTVSKARGGDSVKSGSDDGFIVVPRPLSMPNPCVTRDLVTPSRPERFSNPPTSTDTTTNANRRRGLWE